MKNFILFIFIFMFSLSNYAQDAEAPAEDEVVDISGTSIIGNKELPKSLFIVPWKNAEVGDNTSLTDTLGDSAAVVDRQVFMREIQYYDFLQDLSENN